MLELVMGMGIGGLVVLGAWFVVMGGSMLVDVELVAGALVDELVREWGEDVVALDASGVAARVRVGYLRGCERWGLPRGAADDVVVAAVARWRRVVERPDAVEMVGFKFYE